MTHNITTKRGGLFGLRSASVHTPHCLGSVLLHDDIDTRFRFQIYDIREKVYGVNAVYALASSQRTQILIHYIGKADILSERMASHERMDEARRKGANLLLVHIPTLHDNLGHEEAEKRLIRRYAPPMNKQHLPSFNLNSLISGLGAM